MSEEHEAIRKIAPFIHHCMIRYGDMEGSEKQQEVTPYDVEYRSTCDECGEPLATKRQLLAHIYGALLGPSA